MIKTTNKAPLPFQGQKRNQIKNFRKTLSEFRDGLTFIDVFGGSGLLSQNIKEVFPNATVIWNDYDNYKERLEHIDETKELLEQLWGIVGVYERDKKISVDDKAKILNIISNFNGYKDYLTLSNYLLFSGNYAHSFDELKRVSFYKSKSVAGDSFRRYNANGYLDGVRRVQTDGFILLDEWKEKDCVLILDPPYLQTIASGYKKSFRLKDFLELIFYIKDKSFILFNSDRVDILDILEFANKHLNFNLEWNIKKSTLASFSGNKTSRDYMISRILDKHKNTKDLF